MLTFALNLAKPKRDFWCYLPGVRQNYRRISYLIVLSPWQINTIFAVNVREHTDVTTTKLPLGLVTRPCSFIVMGNAQGLVRNYSMDRTRVDLGNLYHMIS